MTGTHRTRTPLRRLALAAVALTAAGLLAAGTTVAVGESGDDGVDVTLAEKNQSGISGSATYGTMVVAEASGMDPDSRYTSFVYGAGSSATGNNPCIVTGEALAGPTLTVGRWTVDEDGNGSLRADAPLSAEQAGTISIREDSTGTGAVTGPLPVNKLVSCGQIGERRTTPLGDVQDQLPPVKLPTP